MSKPDLSANDFHPGVLTLFDQLVHGRIDRRSFLGGAAKYATAGLTATAMLDMLNPVYADTAEVADDDPRIEARYENYPSQDNWQAYIARPAGVTSNLPTVLVIHENRGRNPYVEDVTRRLAVEGFLTVAPDALSSFGGWPGDDAKGRELQRQLDALDMVKNFVAAFQYAGSLPESNSRVGIVGFCFGGWVVNTMATMLPDMAAGVPYYGRQPKVSEVANINSPMMIQNAGLDSRILAGAAVYEEALQKAGVTFESHIYPDVHHGFHNNTTPRYDDAAATLSWQRTLGFFREHLAVSDQVENTGTDG